MTGTDAGASAPCPAIDTHAHLFGGSTPLAPGAWHVPPAAATAETYLRMLDAHEIAFGVLAAASIHGTNNDEAIDACRRHRRLRTTVIIDPDCGRQRMRAMAGSGVVGVRFQWRNVPDVPDLDGAVHRAMLHRIADMGWHVQLHDDSARLPAYLDVLEDCGVNVVVDHFGRPDPHRGVACPGFQRLLRSVEGGRTWVKLSAGFRLGSDRLASEAAQALLAHGGPERLMWGSDWPFAAFESAVDYTRTLEDLAEWVPDAAARMRILCDTPHAFYFA